MVSKVLKVFYGEDYLPYKDSERTIHFPVGGNTFAGTQNTFRICFYPRDLVGSNDLVEQTSWVLVSKLPNGRLGYELLNTIETDSELGEKYIVFDLSSYYSQFKGVVKLAIRGYQGEIEFTDLDDEGNELPDGAYRVIGTPIIGVTGTIDIAINYSPMVYGEQLLPDEFSQLVAKFDAYLSLNAYQEDSIKRIVVIDSDLVDYSDYDDGQLFYRKDLRKVMQLSSGSLIDYDFGYIANGNYDASKTLEELATIYGLGKTFVLNYTNSNKLICSIVDLGITNQLTYNIFNPYGGVCWQDTLIKTTTLGTIVNGTPNRTFTTKSYVDNAIDTALIGAYKPQGNASVSTLNGLTKSSSMNGYVYNMTDSGNLTNQDSSTTSVLSGDNVVLIWDNGIWHWDNLVGSNYVEKTTSANKVYGTNELGAQTTYTVDDFYDGNIARRDTDGSITVPLTPTQNGHASSKKYVDDLAATKQETLVSGTNIKTINNTTLLGSGNYAFDSAFNELSTNALENSVVAKEFREINYEITMIREALFEVVLNEIDYSVDYAMTYVVPDSLSDTDGTHRVVYSETQLVNVSGNSVVDNQLVQNGNFESTSGWTSGSGIYSISIANNKLTATATSAGNSGDVRTRVDLTANHKYLVIFTITCSKNTTNTKIAFDQNSFIASSNVSLTANQKTNVALIVTNTNNSTNSWFILYGNLTGTGLPVGATIQLENVMIIDLTQMFPTDTPTTDDVRIKWLLSRGYIAYNTGSLLSTSVSGITSSGSNLCNKTQFSAYSYGDDYKKYNPNNAVQVSKGTYTLSANNPKIFNLYVQAFSIDNHTQLSAGVIENINGLPSTVWDGYAKQTTAGGTTRITINVLQDCILTFCGTNSVVLNPMLVIGENALPYEPYVGTLSTITLPTTELKSAGSIHDYLEVVEGNVVEGEQRYNVVKHTLVGNYTFTGNETWVSQSSGRYTCSETSIVSSIKMPIYGGNGNLICNGLLNVAQSVVENANGQIALTGGAIWVHDTNNITSSSTAQTYMAGKTIYFELASEPTPTTIATDLTFEQVSLIIQQGGTINSNFTNVPPNVATTFVVKKAVGE